jgi:hypothetical protein
MVGCFKFKILYRDITPKCPQVIQKLTKFNEKQEWEKNEFF